MGGVEETKKGKGQYFALKCVYAMEEEGEVYATEKKVMTKGTVISIVMHYYHRSESVKVFKVKFVRRLYG